MDVEQKLLLTLHLEDSKENIYLDKYRKLLIVQDGECLFSYVISEEKLKKLETFFNKITDPVKNTDHYVVLNRETGFIRENDLNQVLLIQDFLTKVTWDEFLEEYPKVEIDQKISNDLIDAYDCLFPKELEQIVSYSNSGIIFDEDILMKLFSNDERLSSEFLIDGELMLPVAQRKEETLVYNCSLKIYHGIVDNKIKRTYEDFESFGKPYEFVIEKSISNIEEQLEKLRLGSIKKELGESIELEEIETQIIEVDDTQVEVKQFSKDEFDLSQIIELVEDKIDNLILNYQEKEEQKKLDKAKTKLDLMIERNEQARAKMEKTKETNNKNYSKDISRAIIKSFDNFNLRLNDSSKLVVYHLPYHEYSNSLEIIEVPEPVYKYYNLIVNQEINLGKMKFLVKDLSAKKAFLELLNTAPILDEKGKLITKGDILEFDFDKKKKYKLRQNKAMETWTIHVEKATYDLELRNIEYGKLMKIISQLDLYQAYGEIEKLETKNSLILFLKIVMEKKDFTALAKLYDILENKTSVYEEYITDYNLYYANLEQNELASFQDKEKFIEKANFVKALVNSNWLDYPRYIFGQHRYFERDEFMIEFISYRNDLLSFHALKDYLYKMFKNNSLFQKLDDIGNENLEACLDYLSRVYKYDPVYGETIKYIIEKEIITDQSEEEISLVISKLCRKGIVDYNDFKDYEYQIQELYRKGELKYPIFSELFELGEKRGDI